ncbi:MAG: formylglycine-generating enzyme family protein [Planctomycetes bacterium]|nr:formylglycine-generating enzyme family protein [Planctomycetota bacterium]
MAFNFWSRSKTTSRGGVAEELAPAVGIIPSEEDYDPAPQEILEADPLRAMFQQERFNLILKDRATWKSHPDWSEVEQQASGHLDRQMAIVPEGRASLLRTLTEVPDAEVIDANVPSFLMDIHAVTNDRYQLFVDAGGYDDLSLWPESVWTHLIQFRDQTGQPGPRYWRHGRHDQRLSRHPVVGVCWYEASAFARWIGQRLPTEPEWQLAASWRIVSDTDVLYRFPWGDAMDRKKCNIWASQVCSTVPVDSYEHGAAPNSVVQLIGNVWEWVESDLDIVTEEGVQILGEMTMKSARGGAFDTYFESQCTALFRSGFNALTRAHNLGFRCALSLTDAHWLGKGTE